MQNHTKLQIKFETASVDRQKLPVRHGLDIFTKVGGEYVNPDSLSTTQLIPKFKRKYWGLLRKFYMNGCTILVRLSGLHYDPFEAREYLLSSEKRNNMIVYYRQWRFEKFSEEASYCLIECDKKLFKTLFDRYWFSVAEERRFEAFVLKTQKARQLVKTYQNSEIAGDDKELLRVAELMIDNLHNGFHFRVLSNKSKLQLSAILHELNR